MRGLIGRAGKLFGAFRRAQPKKTLASLQEVYAKFIQKGHSPVTAARSTMGVAARRMPAPKPGYRRMFRGETLPQPGSGLPEWFGGSESGRGYLEAQGRWFASKTQEAFWYIDPRSRAKATLLRQVDEFKRTGSGFSRFSGLGDLDVGEVRRMTYVDVPEEVFQQFRVDRLSKGHSARTYSRAKDIEWFLPREWAQKARQVPGAPEVIGTADELMPSIRFKSQPEQVQFGRGHAGLLQTAQKRRGGSFSKILSSKVRYAHLFPMGAPMPPQPGRNLGARKVGSNGMSGMSHA